MADYQTAGMTPFNVYVPFERADDGDYIRLRGKASTYERDEYGTRVIGPEAYRNLDEFRRFPIMFAEHDRKRPLGHYERVEPTEEALEVEGLVTNPYDPYFPMIRAGSIRALSIGGKARINPTTKEISEIYLKEISVVAIPGNKQAEFSLVRSIDEALERAASGSTDLPLADRNREWDADAAVRRLREYAGGPDKEDIDWNRYARGFFYVDQSNREEFGAYKLPFADVVNGRLMAIPRAIFAAAAALQGARGGVNIPADDLPEVKRKIAAYYRKMDMEPPWVERAAIEKPETKWSRAFFVAEYSRILKQLKGGIDHA